MKRIGLLTSGGDCQALNATMRGVVKGLTTNLTDLEVYGFEEGYKGLIYGNYRLHTKALQTLEFACCPMGWTADSVILLLKTALQTAPCNMWVYWGVYHQKKGKTYCCHWDASKQVFSWMRRRMAQRTSSLTRDGSAV